MKHYNKKVEFIKDAIIWSFLYFGALVIVPGLPFRDGLVLVGLVAVFSALVSILKVNKLFKALLRDYLRSQS